MRDDEIRERLRDQNPWWRGAATQGDPLAWTESDQVLRARAAFDLGYRSKVLDDVAKDPVDDKLVLLRGPRRVGKSVLLKDTTALLCERTDIDPRQLIYLPTDGMRSADINRAVKIGGELTRSVGDARRIWLFDEITGIEHWTQSIKYLRDNSTFGTDTVICTGSSWAEYGEAERDLLAGRAGTTSVNRSRILHPMTFREVLGVTGRVVPSSAPVPPWALQDEAIRAIADLYELYVDDLDLAWQSYLSSGGFPRAIAEFNSSGEVSEAFLHDLAAWLHRDVDPDAADDSVPRLLAEIQRRSSSPLNRNALAQDLGYPNRQNLDVRLNRLVRTFSALWCHQIDDRGERITGSQSKLYLTDPILAWSGPRLRSGLHDPDFTQLTEAAIGVALARSIDADQPGRWISDDSIGYLRTSSGKEIDFAPVNVISPSGPTTSVPIEGKWVATGWRSEAKTIEGKFGRGILATRSILDLNNTSWALPAPMLALLLQ